MKIPRRIVVVWCLVGALLATGWLDAGSWPGVVSPGARDRAVAVEGRCPVFSWVEIPGAVSFELVAYELWDRPDEWGKVELDLERATEVLFTRVPGGATSWTPALEQCFAPGASFVWFVRAVFDPDTGEASEWSDPLLFSIAAAPTVMEVEQALSVLERFLEYGGDPGTGAVPQIRAADPGAEPGRAKAGSTKIAQRSVLTGTGAIRGEQPDVAGETFGVVGVSASPDGAGLGAANTAGGPDLVLDGSADGVADAELSESGIDRPSASPQTFAVDNTGGGGIVLEVGGVEVVTTATDRDTLSGLACAGDEIAKWNGSSWVCAPDIDTNTDTMAGLGPLCATGEIASWNGSAWVCADDADTLGDVHCPWFLTNRVPKWDGSQWSCGSDDDTTYSFGPGLIVNNGHVAIDPAAFSKRISVLHSADIVGRYSSLAIGSDGLGRVSYND